MSADLMVDHHHNENSHNDALRCLATLTSAASRDSSLQSHDETRRRHGDVTPTLLIGDDDDDVSWSDESGSEVAGCGHRTTKGRSPPPPPLPSSSSSSLSSFICVCVCILCFCFTLHSCCIIVNTVGWT